MYRNTPEHLQLEKQIVKPSPARLKIINDHADEAAGPAGLSLVIQWLLKNNKKDTENTKYGVFRWWIIKVSLY